MILRSLHGRLSLVFLGLVSLVGLLGIVSTLVTTRLYLQEVNQHLNLDLAPQIGMAKSDLLLDQEGQPRTDGLKELFHWLMVVNPGVEFYLIDTKGTILGYDAAPGRVKREQIEMAPVHEFVIQRARGEAARLPVLGDDPRSLDRRKIFSASPLPVEGEPTAFLYIILASEDLDSVQARLQGSWVLRMSLWLALGSVAVTLLGGLLLFRRLTAPLRRLTDRIHRFRQEDGAAVRAVGAERGSDANDEVGELKLAFEEMSARIQAQLARIEQVEGQRRELIANVSHDLRTPLASLQGYLETLSLKSDRLGEEERLGYLRIALRQGERLSRLVDELFELTRLETGDMKIQEEPFSVAELVQDNVQKLRLSAEEQGVSLDARIDPDLPLVKADIALIERVLENLLENALKFTPTGGSVRVELVEAPSEVFVRVADTGVGIPKEEIPQVFDRAYRGQMDAAEKPSGAGLGLAIVRRILDLHGRELDVESKPGRGSVFSFSLALS
jgi:signal transduction histidine kinase